MRVGGYIPFGEKEEGLREKSSFDHTKEETNQERASIIVDETGQGAADVQILADNGGTNATHLIMPQNAMHAGR